jgi:hypothetical protein
MVFKERSAPQTRSLVASRTPLQNFCRSLVGAEMDGKRMGARGRRGRVLFEIRENGISESRLSHVTSWTVVRSAGVGVHEGSIRTVRSEEAVESFITILLLRPLYLQLHSRTSSFLLPPIF